MADSTASDGRAGSRRWTGGCHAEGLQEVVADKGYHSTPVLMDLEKMRRPL